MTREQHLRSRRVGRTSFRRKVAAGVVASGLASAGSVGLTAPPAGAQAPIPETVVRCEGESALYLDVRNFPAGETLHFYLALLEEERDFGFDGTFSTDATGSGFVGGSGVFPADYRPEVLFVAYRDVNANQRWDAAADDTVFRGTGSVTTCPQTLTLSPK